MSLTLQPVPSRTGLSRPEPGLWIIMAYFYWLAIESELDACK